MGGNLSQIIKNQSNLCWQEVADYIQQILTAVAYLHYQKIIHRDIKPQNIMVVSSWNKSQQNYIKIIDFGISCIQKDVNLKKVVGTTFYLAPEVLKKNYTEKCDVWSIGIIAYQLLTNKFPYQYQPNSNILNIIKNTTKIDFQPLYDLNVDRQFIELIQSLLDTQFRTRVSAKQALKHPIFQKKQQAFNFNYEIVDIMSQFIKPNDFIKSIMYLIIHYFINDYDKNIISRLYLSLDKDCQGEISFDQLLKGFIKIFNIKDIKKMESICKKIFRNAGLIDEKINYTLFLMMTLDYKFIINYNNVQNVFNFLDKDQKGELNCLNFKYFFGDSICQNKNWNLQFLQLKTNSDKINFTSFYNFIRQT